MAENYYQKRERQAVEALDAMLVKPPMPDDGMCSDGECFDPWDLFPCVYGSYSSEFDDLALAVLSDINVEACERCDLAAEIFREILCTTGFCDYGTSPRVCFATTAFKERLPRFIERWREYAQIMWKN
jgi:hypothetical protein